MKKVDKLSQIPDNYDGPVTIIDETETKTPGRLFTYKGPDRESDCVYNNDVYVCHNSNTSELFGFLLPDDLLRGYKHSIYLGNKTRSNQFHFSYISSLIIDDQSFLSVGSTLILNNVKAEVIFRSGELVVLKYLDTNLVNPASENYTVDGLLAEGWKLLKEP